MEHSERSEESPLFYFSGGVGGGSVHLLDSRRRLLAKSARGDGLWVISSEARNLLLYYLEVKFKDY